MPNGHLSLSFCVYIFVQAPNAHAAPSRLLALLRGGTDKRPQALENVVDTTELQRALSAINGAVGPAGHLAAVAGRDAAFSASITLLATTCFRLQQASYKATLHKANITTVSNLFVEILNAVIHLLNNAPQQDMHAKDLLNKLSSAANDAITLAQSCQEPGWLAQLARSDVCLEQLQMISKTAIDLVAVYSRIVPESCLTNVHRLHAGPWVQVSARVRAILRSVGNGDIEVGITRLRSDSYISAAEQLSTMLGVSVKAIVVESGVVSLVSLGHKTILDANLRTKEIKKILHEYAKTYPGVALTQNEFKDVLRDMGLLDSVNGRARPIDGVIDESEFKKFCLKLPITGIRGHLRLSTSLEMERRLFETFSSFQGSSFLLQRKSGGTATSGELDSMHFARLCRDAGLLSADFTIQQLDVLFTCITKNLARPRLDFDHFLVALQAIGDKRDLNLDTVVEMVVKVERPHYERNGTRAEYVALHDDPSKISGIYARGGPDCSPTNVDLQAFVGRYSSSSTRTPSKASPPTPGVVTAPKSPRLATASRAGRTGPLTPARGASQKVVNVGQIGQSSRTAFGRSTVSTPKTQGSRIMNPRTPSPKMSCVRERLQFDDKSTRMTPMATMDGGGSTNNLVRSTSFSRVQSGVERTKI